MKKINIYDEIKKDIIKCFYKPGEYLEEQALAKRYGTSRTPIREALGVLKREGWIENTSKKGVCAANITLKQLKDLFQLRVEIEPMILRFSFNLFSEARLLDLKKKLQEAVKNESIEELSSLDDLFHEEILMSSRNELAISLLKNIQEKTTRLRYLTCEDKKETINSAEEHIKIIDAILNKDLSEASKHLINHIDNNQLYFMRNVNLYE